MRKVALNRVSRHDVFSMKFIQIHGKEFKKFFVEVLALKMVIWVRREV